MNIFLFNKGKILCEGGLELKTSDTSNAKSTTKLVLKYECLLRTVSMYLHNEESQAQRYISL